MKKIILVCLFLFAGLLSVFASGQKELNSASESGSSATTLKVVSLAPNITEIVYALGADELLIGRSDNCNYPEQVLEIPSAGNVWQPNVEVIVSMQPDVVLAASLLDPAYKDAIERAGIKVVHILSEESIDGTYDLIRQVGNAIGYTSQAENLCAEIYSQFKEISDKVSGVTDKKTCVYLLGWGQFGDYAATGETFLNDLIELAGGINIAKDAKYWEISQELLIEANPQLIVLPDYEYAKADIVAFRNTEPYSRLTGKIVTVNGDTADRQGVRSPIFAKAVAENLYPELFK